MCYCGKLQDPPADPWLAPHSCGSVCQRELKPTCGHTCLLLCHPGTHTHSHTQRTNDCGGLSSCNQQQQCVHSRPLSSMSNDGFSLLFVWQGEAPPPSLQQQGTETEKQWELVHLFCPHIQCVSYVCLQAWSCQQKCGRVLPCRQHTCTMPCHTGAHCTGQFLLGLSVFLFSSFQSCLSFVLHVCVCLCALARVCPLPQGQRSEVRVRP